MAKKEKVENGIVNIIQTTKLWNDYIKPGRSRNDIVDLAIDVSYQDIYRQRAIQILLTPDFGSLPFRFKTEKGVTSFVALGDSWIDKLGEEGAVYTASLIPGYIAQAQRMIDDDRYEGSDAYNARQALVCYNRMIPDLMEKIPGIEADRLFEHYEINDPVPYSSMETESGYNPLRLLLKSSVDEKWKKIALQRMHEVIASEMDGVTEPRVDWEEARECYLQILNTLVTGETPVSQDVVKGELQFMMAMMPGEPIVRSWNITHALFFLEGEDRIRFVRAQVLGNKDRRDRFSINRKADLDTARMLIRDFGSDQELKQHLERLIQRYEEERAEQVLRDTKDAAEQAGILRRMRKLL